MRTRLVAVAVLISLLTGCASVREVDLDSGGSGLAEVDRAAKGKDITVELVSGGTRSGRKLDIGPDTTCWNEWDRSGMGEGDPERVCVPTSEIQKITVHRHLRGGLKGAGCGLGAAVAAILAVSAAVAPGLKGNDMAGLAVLFYGGIVIVVGTVTGTVVGVVKDKDVYIINH